MEEDRIERVEAVPVFGVATRQADRPAFNPNLQQQVIWIETGRGQPVSVVPHSSAIETIERLAEEANYNGYYRVYRNGIEILDYASCPEFIEPGDRWQIGPWDKVG